MAGTQEEVATMKEEPHYARCAKMYHDISVLREKMEKEIIKRIGDDDDLWGYQAELMEALRTIERIENKIRYDRWKYLEGVTSEDEDGQIEVDFYKDEYGNRVDDDAVNFPFKWADYKISE